MSLIRSAQLNGHEPHAYLRDVLMRLPTHRHRDTASLLPHRWQPAATTLPLPRASSWDGWPLTTKARKFTPLCSPGNEFLVTRNLLQAEASRSDRHSVHDASTTSFDVVSQLNSAFQRAGQPHCTLSVAFRVPLIDAPAAGTGVTSVAARGIGGS
jgi:IS66 C-terminal element